MTYEMLTGCYPFEDSSFDWLSAGPAVPFTPIATYVPGAAKKWQALFEHSFSRELSDRHDSAEAFCPNCKVLQIRVIGTLCGQRTKSTLFACAW